MGPSLFNNLSVYLFVAIFLLGAGILGVVHRRTLIGMLVSVELILNGAGLNLVAINRFIAPDNSYGVEFSLFIMGIAAAEATIALALIILIFKKVGRVEGDKMTEMRD